jgi:hypothetical protein
LVDLDLNAREETVFSCSIVPGIPKVPFFVHQFVQPMWIAIWLVRLQDHLGNQGVSSLRSWKHHSRFHNDGV